MKIKYPYRPSSRWAFMQWTDIPSTANPGYVYLRRLRIIHTPWCGLYLHLLVEPDTVPDPHDHPWPFLSLVLRGGYIEEVFKLFKDNPHNFAYNPITHVRGSLHGFLLAWAHRITHVEPNTWTLVLVGPKVREWGFYTNSGFVPRKQYIAGLKAKSTSTPDPFDS